jgi:hypothetical protein
MKTPSLGRDWNDSSEGCHDPRVGTMQKSDQEEYLQITSYTWISINPPCASNAGLSVEDPKLIETKDLFQATSRGNARLASTNDQNRVVCIAIGIVAIFLSDCPAVRVTFPKERRMHF